MELASVFYIMAIIFMTLFFVAIIMLIVILFYIKSKLTQLTNKVEERLDYITTNPGEIAVGAGVAAADIAFQKIKKVVSKKKN